MKDRGRKREKEWMQINKVHVIKYIVNAIVQSCYNFFAFLFLKGSPILYDFKLLFIVKYLTVWYWTFYYLIALVSGRCLFLFSYRFQWFVVISTITMFSISIQVMELVSVHGDEEGRLAIILTIWFFRISPESHRSMWSEYFQKGVFTRHMK